MVELGIGRFGLDMHRRAGLWAAASQGCLRQGWRACAAAGARGGAQGRALCAASRAGPAAGLLTVAGAAQVMACSIAREAGAGRPAEISCMDVIEGKAPAAQEITQGAPCARPVRRRPSAGAHAPGPYSACQACHKLRRLPPCSAPAHPLLILPPPRACGAGRGAGSRDAGAPGRPRQQTTPALTAGACARGGAGAQVVYTYDVFWELSDVSWASRWDAYLRMPGGRVHWFSILNSLMVVLVMSSIVAMILMRTVRRDLARYEGILGDAGAHMRLLITHRFCRPA